MSQLFSSGAVLALKLALVLVPVTAATAVVAWRAATDYPFARGAPVGQPVPFSHKHHAGEDGIDCRYCHDSVEDAAFAGIPATQVCMTCHSQLFTDAPLLEPVRASLATGERLRWTRVHDLPDFVYFDHRPHVGSGIACQTCHGDVRTMPLTLRVHSLQMQWCLDCHRRQARADLTDCSTCHR